MSITVGILGASGFTGAELFRLLLDHPSFRVECAVGDTQAGQLLSQLYPHLGSRAAIRLRKLDEAASELNSLDLIFSALPHASSHTLLSEFKNKLVVDLSADFRLDAADDYERWYGYKHAAPQALGEWTYALPEFFAGKIRASSRLANPGCYATAALLSAVPLVQAGLISGNISVTGMSGHSGAGRKSQAELILAQAYEDVRAYKVAAHQHTAEIEMVLKRFAGPTVRSPNLISFTPVLVPMSRGILSVSTFEAAKDLSQARLDDCFIAAFEGKPFIQYLRGQQPATKNVRGSNTAMLSATVDARTAKLIVTCAIDNLVKGAAGQAIQNANIALGLEETLGLPRCGVWP